MIKLKSLLTEEFTKAARIRDPKTGKLYYNCRCGAKPEVTGKTVTCQCGTSYNPEGWIVGRNQNESVSSLHEDEYNDVYDKYLEAKKAREAVRGTDKEPEAVRNFQNAYIDFIDVLRKRKQETKSVNETETANKKFESSKNESIYDSIKKNEAPYASERRPWRSADSTRSKPKPKKGSNVRIKKESINESKFKQNDFVRILKYPKNHINAMGRVDGFSKDKKKIHVVNMNMPFSGTISDFFDPSELKLISKNESINEAKMTWWEIYIGNKMIDKIQYPADMTADEVEKSLINHDGYDSRIMAVPEEKNESVKGENKYVATKDGSSITFDAESDTDAERQAVEMRAGRPKEIDYEVATSQKVHKIVVGSRVEDNEGSHARGKVLKVNLSTRSAVVKWDGGDQEEISLDLLKPLKTNENAIIREDRWVIKYTRGSTKSPPTKIVRLTASNKKEAEAKLKDKYGWDVRNILYMVKENTTPLKEELIKENTEWEYQDAAGKTHRGYMKQFFDRGGTDVTYQFVDKKTGEVSMVSGSRLKAAKVIREQGIGFPGAAPGEIPADYPNREKKVAKMKKKLKEDRPETQWGHWKIGKDDDPHADGI